VSDTGSHAQTHCLFGSFEYVQNIYLEIKKKYVTDNLNSKQVRDAGP